LKNLIEYSYVTDGKLNRRVSSVIKSFISDCEGKYIKVELSQGKKRSIEQNAYLHLALTILKDGLNELGNKFTLNEVKDLVKFKFLKADVYNELTGELIGERIKSTTELTTVEMMVFIDSFREWSMQTFNIYIPSPNEQLELNK